MSIHSSPCCYAWHPATMTPVPLRLFPPMLVCSVCVAGWTLKGFLPDIPHCFCLFCPCISSQSKPAHLSFSSCPKQCGPNIHTLCLCVCAMLMDLTCPCPGRLETAKINFQHVFNVFSLSLRAVSDLVVAIYLTLTGLSTSAASTHGSALQTNPPTRNVSSWPVVVVVVDVV